MNASRPRHAASVWIVAFAVFQPLRRRVQSAVDWRFDRARYDSARIVEGFAGRLRNELDLEALRQEIGRAATESVRPATAAVWLRQKVGARDGRATS